VTYVTFTVLKYRIPVPQFGVESTIKVPRGSIPMTVATQDGVPYIWVEAPRRHGPPTPDEDGMLLNPLEERSLYVVPTGALVALPFGNVYLASVHSISHAGLVFHIYYVPEAW
jgi:hypothetical protein